jgi:hypothetical protein
MKFLSLLRSGTIDDQAMNNHAPLVDPFVPIQPVAASKDTGGNWQRSRWPASLNGI